MIMRNRRVLALTTVVASWPDGQRDWAFARFAVSQ